MRRPCPDLVRAELVAVGDVRRQAADALGVEARHTDPDAPLAGASADLTIVATRARTTPLALGNRPERTAGGRARVGYARSVAESTGLPTRTLGRTNLRVTRLGYGAMELRGEPRGRPIDDAQAASILRAVLDSGINYLDTSIDYGLSEERIGRFIGGRRAEFFLASKCGCQVGYQPRSANDRPAHVFTRANVTAGVEQSLRRLGTDYLDVVQFHASPAPAALEAEGGLAALLDLQRAGKVRFLGMSGTLPNLPAQIDMGVFDVFQIPYSALQREHEGLISQAAGAGAGTVVRGGAARGALAPDKPGVDPLGAPEGSAQSRWDRAGLDDLLDGASRTEFVVRFTLSHPDVDTTIVGTVNPSHLAANVAAARKGPLPADVYAEAKRRLTEAA
ncbi:MAG: aldo/keto reductase [Chloroflexi bacterium]|nr:aldo/keto reductase [Chloroflexota bacterium]